jgi:large subunit ribosomal protein L6
MSRIGKKPVAIPNDVTVTVSGQNVSVKGPKGELDWDFPEKITVAVDAEAKQVQVNRIKDNREGRALHGLTRALINNMVTGVVTPFEKKLEIQGVGYQTFMDGNKLALNVGFSHAVTLEVPEGVSCVCSSQTQVVVQSCDKHAVGQFAANIRAVRPPDPYKGKGIRYLGEFVRRKAGKAFGAK